MKIMIKNMRKELKNMEILMKNIVLISALTGLVLPSSDTWLVDSGASKNVTCYKDSLSCLVQEDSPHKVMLGDDY